MGNEVFKRSKRFKWSNESVEEFITIHSKNTLTVIRISDISLIQLQRTQATLDEDYSIGQ
jgi:hypothetical protein